MHTISDKRLLMLRPSEISTDLIKVRKNFDEYELKRLAENISINGIIEPLSVKRTPDKRYELILGQRRLMAAKMAGLRRVPCVLHRADELSCAVYSVIENTHRTPLTFFEEAQAVKRLMEDFSLGESEVGMRLGMAQSTLINKLRLLKLDDSIKKRIIAANLSERHAMALLKIAAENREDALDKIIAGALNINQTNELINGILNPKTQSAATDDTALNKLPVRKVAIGDERFFSNSLSKLISTMQNAGIGVTSRRFETEQYIEYKVRISKSRENTYCQLSVSGLESGLI